MSEAVGFRGRAAGGSRCGARRRASAPPCQAWGVWGPAWVRRSHCRPGTARAFQRLRCSTEVAARRGLRPTSVVGWEKGERPCIDETAGRPGRRHFTRTGSRSPRACARRTRRPARAGRNHSAVTGRRVATRPFLSPRTGEPRGTPSGGGNDSPSGRPAGRRGARAGPVGEAGGGHVAGQAVIGRWSALPTHTPTR